MTSSVPASLEMNVTQNSDDRLSVVIPSYNCEATICVTLDSLVAQRRPADEIIIVDDHSDIPVRDIVQDRYPGIRILRHDANRGVQNARNTGFREVTGDYVLFLDADDILCPEFLDTAYLALTAHPAAGACFAGFYKCFDGEAAPILAAHMEKTVDPRVLPKGEGLTFYLNNTGAFIPSFSILRKAALDDLVSHDELYSTHLAANEDFHLFSRVLAKNEALHIEAPMGGYFLRPDSLSRNQLKMWLSREAAVSSLLGMADQLSLSAYHRAFLEKMRASAVRQYARLLDNNGERGRSAKCLWDELRRAPSVKTFALLALTLCGLQKKKIKYGGLEY